MSTSTRIIALAMVSILAGSGAAAAQGRGYLGIAISCSDCSWKESPTGNRWRFSSPPVVEAVDTAGPAARSGVRAGDVIVAIDGLPLTSDVGARRFADAAPRQPLSLSIRRGDETRTASIVPVDRPAAAPSGSLAESLRAAGKAIAGTRGPSTDSPIRFSGSVAGLDAEVRGSPDVTVVLDDGSCSAVIVTATNRITLKSRGGCAKRER